VDIDGARYDRVTRALDPPFGLLDLDALDANADDLVRRAAGKPIRLASKSVRCREVLRRIHDRPGFRGILGYTVAEAFWLAADFDDVVVAYPSAERSALSALAADPKRAARVTLMVDDLDQLDLIEAAAHGTRLRVCLDLDASLRLWGGRLHIGTRRSPLHSVEQALDLARAILARPGLELVGAMAYEGQIAGVGDAPPGRPDRAAVIHRLQTISAAELATRRAEIVAALREVADLQFVNGGGTGSLETTSREAAVTEVAAGSGLFAPGIFDAYRSFQARPAAFFALSVTRRPSPGMVTVTGGGWVASGPPGRDRLPIPAYPAGLRYVTSEAAGEVQTPLAGSVADRLAIGDRVWFRHAKAGELSEHVDGYVAVDGETIAGHWPTYRGEGKTFL
jgi:D-serine deaminase-like pyridoxal phosphate-dependent protein